MTHKLLDYTSEPLVPKKPYRGLWLAVGAGIGTAVGVSSDNLAFSLAIGVALGAVLDWIAFRRSR